MQSQMARRPTPPRAGARATKPSRLSLVSKPSKKDKEEATLGKRYQQAGVAAADEAGPGAGRQSN